MRLLLRATTEAPPRASSSRSWERRPPSAATGTRGLYRVGLAPAARLWGGRYKEGQRALDLAERVMNCIEEHAGKVNVRLSRPAGQSGEVSFSIFDFGFWILDFRLILDLPVFEVRVHLSADFPASIF